MVYNLDKKKPLNANIRGRKLKRIIIFNEAEENLNMESKRKSLLSDLSESSNLIKNHPGELVEYIEENLIPRVNFIKAERPRNIHNSNNNSNNNLENSFFIISNLMIKLEEIKKDHFVVEDFIEEMRNRFAIEMKYGEGENAESFIGEEGDKSNESNDLGLELETYLKQRDLYNDEFRIKESYKLRILPGTIIL
ncbi:MAG: hypothetical protein ACTSU2_10520, partial [Promethearchaeota archaeon]